MNAYCPDCETDLDQSTGICPACRWDPLLASSRQAAAAPEREISLSERYRGTEYDTNWQAAAVSQNSGISRGRAFVIVGLVAAASLYGVVLGILGLF